MEQIDRVRFKVIFPVPSFCLLFLGVNQQRPNSDQFRSLDRAEESTFQKAFSQAGSLLSPVHGQTGEQQDGTRCPYEASLVMLKNPSADSVLVR